MILLPWVNKVVIVFAVDRFFPSACRTIMYEKIQDGAHRQLQIYLANRSSLYRVRKSNKIKIYKINSYLLDTSSCISFRALLTAEGIFFPSNLHALVFRSSFVLSVLP